MHLRATQKKPASSTAQARAMNAANRNANASRIFLLSSANLSGKRGKLMWSGNSRCRMALRLRDGGAPLGEIFSFVSGLYFRGKLTYAEAFTRPPRGVPGVMIITSSHGLMNPAALVTVADLRIMAASPIGEAEMRYRKPLERDARQLAATLRRCEVVLLGSIATPKYIEPLFGIFGAKLMFPAEFAGIGDMSRGGLMLRATRDGLPLSYARVSSAMPHASR